MAEVKSYKVPTIPKVEKSEKIDDEIVDEIVDEVIEFTLAPEVLERIDSLEEASDELKTGFKEILTTNMKSRYEQELEVIKRSSTFEICSIGTGISYQAELEDFPPSFLNKIIQKKCVQLQSRSLKEIEAIYQNRINNLRTTVNKSKELYIFTCGHFKGNTEAEALQKYKDSHLIHSQVSELFVRELARNKGYKNPKFTALIKSTDSWEIVITCDIEYS